MCESLLLSVSCLAMQPHLHICDTEMGQNEELCVMLHKRVKLNVPAKDILIIASLLVKCVTHVFMKSFNI